jgi:release factor glutamine methyltransferase
VTQAARQSKCWREVRADVSRRLASAGIASPEAEARWMTEYASGYAGSEWLDVEDDAPHDRALTHLAAMCERRVAGEPLQYVLGSWSFRGLDLMVDDRVLIPRPETEQVVEIALEEAERLGFRRGARGLVRAEPTGTVADLGTGSGAIALALEAELPEVEVWATDISEDALAVARANVAGAGAARVRLASGSWFDALPIELRGRLDLVVSNPPYVTDAEFAQLPDEIARYEPHRALVAGPRGTEALEHLLTVAPRWLGERATMVCEIAPHQADPVRDLARSMRYSEVEVRPDLTGRPRALVARVG